MRSFGASAIATPVASSSDVVIPELVDTLEWVLDSPPNVHQFEEPPVSKRYRIFYYDCEPVTTQSIICLSLSTQIIVEVEHLKNLKVSDD